MSAEDKPSSDSKARMRPFLHSESEDASGDTLWNRYFDVVEAEDKSSIERWQGSTNGLLTFVSCSLPSLECYLLYHIDRHICCDRGNFSIPELCTAPA